MRHKVDALGVIVKNRTKELLGQFHFVTKRDVLYYYFWRIFLFESECTLFEYNVTSKSYPTCVL